MTVDAIYNDDCLIGLTALPAESVDSIVTDPPYGLEFMGKDWDAPWKRAGWQSGGGFSKPGIGDRKTAWPSFSATSKFGAANPTCATCGGRARGARKCTCESPEWKPIGKRRNPENDGLPNTLTGAGMGHHMRVFQQWCGAWAIEAYRVLKPGGHILCFGGSRTYHRMACAIEDAGFEIRDQIMWIYGSGFPKSLDVSKAIDKSAGQERKAMGFTQWASVRGTSRKSEYGFKGGDSAVITSPATDEAKQWDGWGTALKPAHEPIVLARKPLNGTVAQNVLKHGTGAINVDGCRVELNGDYKCKANGRPSQTGLGDNYNPKNANQADTVGRWPANVILDEEAGAVLDEQSGRLTSGSRTGNRTRPKTKNTYGSFEIRTEEPSVGDSGGASRFFYCPKASSKERGEDNIHPTVKPQALMRYLVRLVTPRNGVTLDPFMGSGTTALACISEGVHYIGFERDPAYFDIANKRIAKHKQQLTFAAA